MLHEYRHFVRLCCGFSENVVSKSQATSNGLQEGKKGHLHGMEVDGKVMAGQGKGLHKDTMER